MAVNVAEGPLIRLVDVPEKVKWLPASRGGAKVNFGTLYGWARAGKKNRGGQVIKLEVMQFGSSLATNEPALIRFFERLAAEDSDQQSATPTQQRKAYERAQARLAAMGV